MSPEIGKWKRLFRRGPERRVYSFGNGKIIGGFQATLAYFSPMSRGTHAPLSVPEFRKKPRRSEITACFAFFFFLLIGTRGGPTGRWAFDGTRRVRAGRRRNGWRSVSIRLRSLSLGSGVQGRAVRLEKDEVLCVGSSRRSTTLSLVPCSSLLEREVLPLSS